MPKMGFANNKPAVKKTNKLHSMRKIANMIFVKGEAEERKPLFIKMNIFVLKFKQNFVLW
jgi:hypothetical protein